MSTKNNNNEEIISPAKMAWKRLKKNKLAMAGLIILVVIIVVSIIGPFLSSYTADTMDPDNITIGPCDPHILGTDALGSDILTSLLFAG